MLSRFNLHVLRALRSASSSSAVAAISSTPAVVARSNAASRAASSVQLLPTWMTSLRMQAFSTASGSDDEVKHEIFITGIPWEATEEELLEKFAVCGEITNARIPTVKGRPSGYAFVTFADIHGMRSGLKLDGEDFGGRWMKIRAAEKKEAPTKPEGCKSVFIGNLSFDVDEDMVREFFGDCGEIVSCRVAVDRETGRPRGFCHLDFATTEAVDAAIKLKGEELAGRDIRVDYANDREGFSGRRGGDRDGGRSFGGRGGGRGGYGGGRGGGRGGFGDRDGGRGGRRDYGDRDGGRQERRSYGDRDDNDFGERRGGRGGRGGDRY